MGLARRVGPHVDAVVFGPHADAVVFGTHRSDAEAVAEAIRRLRGLEGSPSGDRRGRRIPDPEPNQTP